MADSWLYCRSCSWRIGPNAACAPKCPDCGSPLRIWEAPDGSPPPEDVSNVPILPPGGLERVQPKEER